MSSRTALLATIVVLGLALLAAVALLVPWRPLPLHGLTSTPIDPQRDFSAV